MTARSALADGAVRLLDEAARANLECPWLRGRLLELPAEGELVVAGDLHGDAENYRLIVEAAQLAQRPDRTLVLQELTHDTRTKESEACGSWQLIEMAARLKAAFPQQVFFLFGNHDMSELADLPIAKDGRDLNERFALGVERAYGANAPEVMAAYRRFWASLPLATDAGNGVFLCHSTPRRSKMDGIDREWLAKHPDAARYERSSPVYDLVWGRDYSNAAAEDFARRVGAEVLLVGHTKCPNGYDVPNGRHVILDSSHPKGAFAVLPLGRALVQQEVVASIRPLRKGVKRSGNFLEW